MANCYTDASREYQESNEDALLVVEEYPLLVVADGMGGYRAGEVASSMIVKHLSKLELDGELAAAAAHIKGSLLDTNSEILDFARRELGGATVGSTVVAMVAFGCRGVCLWAGDSRLYRLRRGVLTQLTEDHSYVAALVRDGLITPEQARHHPSSNIITRAVGAAADLSVAEKTFEINDDDIYLLCSDGLYNEVEGDEIAQVLLHNDVARGAQQLLSLCLSRAAKDNVSLVIARASAPPGPYASSARPWR